MQSCRLRIAKPKTFNEEENYSLVSSGNVLWVNAEKVVEKQT
jgi:hypothetical protein